MNYDYLKAKELYINGMKVKHISKKLNIPLTSLIRYLKKEGIYKGRTIILSDNQIQQIKDLRSKGWSIERIAKEINTTYNGVKKYIDLYSIEGKTIYHYSREKTR